MKLIYSDVGELDQKLEQTIKEFPQLRKKATAEVGDAMLTQLHSNIGGRGKVQRWQDVHLGSGGGYAAVRPKAKTYQTTKQGQQYAVGHVTNAIDAGHKIRPPGGKNKRYQPRFTRAYVRGRAFYAQTQGQVDGIAGKIADNLMDQMAKKLED